MAYQCDFCAKTIKPHQTHQVKMMVRCMIDEISDVKKYDLCSKCKSIFVLSVSAVVEKMEVEKVVDING